MPRIYSLNVLPIRDNENQRTVPPFPFLSSLLRSLIRQGREKSEGRRVSCDACREKIAREKREKNERGRKEQNDAHRGDRESTMSLFPLDRAKSSEITRLTLEPLGSEKGEREGGEEERIFPDRALPFLGDTNRCRITDTVFKPDSLIPRHRRSNRPRRALDVVVPSRKRTALPAVRFDSIFDPVKRVRFDPSKSNFFRSTVFPHLPFFPLGIRTSPNYLDSSRTRYSRYNWCSLCPRFVFVAISRWMDEKYDELLKRIN